MKEDELLIDGGPPILIPPGDYDAKVFRIYRSSKFKRNSLQMRFEIVSMDSQVNGVVLDAWLPLGDAGKPGKGSKIVRWYLTLDQWARKDRVSLKAFRNRLLRVTVRTVERDYRQKPLSKALLYSVVDEVLGTVALIQEENRNV
jgi:hypothetical protein